MIAVICLVGDLAQRAGRDVEDRRLGGAARIGQLHGLHRLRIVIFPVPHVDVGLRLGRFWRLGLLLFQADEQPRAVGAPARRGEFADHHAGGEGRMPWPGSKCAACVCGGADAAPGEQDVVALLLAARFVAAKHGEVALPRLLHASWS